MADSNPTLIYRPLWAGVCVISSTVRSRGTIGCFAVDKASNVWLVTARHVFTNAAVAPTNPVTVHQPDDFSGPVPINDPSAWKIDASGEVIATMLLANTKVICAWASLGAWSGVAAPKQGSIVSKLGIATGVTRGRISNVTAQGFNVEHLAGLPNFYQTNAGGDSGSAWMDTLTGNLIGFHIGEQAGGVAAVKRADASLASMGLQLTIGSKV